MDEEVNLFGVNQEGLVGNEDEAMAIPFSLSFSVSEGRVTDGDSGSG